ncbi:BTB/POZ and TAZ domain-containing protein 4-like [Magnolia sinica]|uniref:BTB/POZ and TAZ domain-containing protein 4-like n=1 Tax=Magnolia sinica TaxID=86752 RepID=UPI0026593C66|nr:BTB/POZ and TAZ domain-containing protein 4-like [Magnolia sinica]
MGEMEETCEGFSPLISNMVASDAPLFTRLPTNSNGYVAATTRDLWNCLLDEGYKADVCVHTDNGGVIHAHTGVLGGTSPVLKNMLTQSKVRPRSISIHGVPHQAVRAFIRYLYSSCYEHKEMDEFSLHLLVLSHVFVISSLKKACSHRFEMGLLTDDNVVDVFQMAHLCDAPRLRLICHRLIVKNFKVISTTDGWRAMKHSRPQLEKELLESLIEADSRKQERLKKIKEKKIYLRLSEAMEALVHICKDGCRTIGPHDQVLKGNGVPCDFPACKGLEMLIRHFAGCKARVAGGCTHCKRMSQLLELHSRICATSDVCKVPLCRHFKKKLKHQHQTKKDERRWKLLVSRVLAAKHTAVASVFPSAIAVVST